ncbi:MAG: alpha/beta hydrolase [Bacteroidales bacterium]|nr:alpha/beta hydrolase [Clostridium sp.]MCM1203719.1 alpha/beta hydrolase [Bacteroidales bacterium]
MKGKQMKEFLHKVTKIFLILLSITALITLAVVGWVFFSDRSKLKKEAPLLTKPPGEMVETGGHRLHVYMTGKEDAGHTIVFLHGTGMTDAAIAMQPMWEELSADYRIVYIDRPGNGYSEAGDNDKSVARMTDEMRETLEAVGVEGPVILFAQTTSGITANYWAVKYPEEVEAVIGLDMAYVEEYASYHNEDSGFKYMMYLFSQIGVTRHVDSAYPDDRYNLYSDKQLLVRNALISRGSYTKDMYQEDKAVGDNAREVEKLGFMKDIPILALLSNPIKEPYLSTDSAAQSDLRNMKEKYPDYDFEQAYNKSRREYFKQFGNVECIEMAGPSALYTYVPDEVAEQVRMFIEERVD